MYKVLSRKRAINSSRLGPPFAVLFAILASPCSPLRTLLEAASAVLTACLTGPPRRSSPCKRMCGMYDDGVMCPMSNRQVVFVEGFEP